MRSSRLKLTLCALVACAAIGTSALAAAEAFDNRSRPAVQPMSADEVPASSIPSREIDLSFAQPGLISDVKVKDGDIVKKGTVLAQQDTSVEDAAIERERFLLKSNVQNRAATAQRDLANVKLKRAEKLFKGEAGSALELEEAQLEVTVANLKVELAGEETEAKRLDIRKLEKQIERMKIAAPYDGLVRKVEVALGEVSDPQKPSIVFVVNDPVKIETKVPTRIAATLKLGQTLPVRYIDEEKWRDAKIIYFDPVADATLVGGSQLIHLEMSNPEGRRSGQEMAVKLPQNVATAK
jgi:RND family efflux transporter MFP subunit